MTDRQYYPRHYLMALTWVKHSYLQKTRVILPPKGDEVYLLACFLLRRKNYCRGHIVTVEAVCMAPRKENFKTSLVIPFF